MSKPTSCSLQDALARHLRHEAQLAHEARTRRSLRGRGVCSWGAASDMAAEVLRLIGCAERAIDSNPSLDFDAALREVLPSEAPARRIRG